MNHILEELRRLNINLNRLLEYLAPAQDPQVFHEYQAFRAEMKGGKVLIKGVGEVDPVTLKELKGIDHVIQEARKNIERFLKGLPAQDTLIYGPRGTGKSSLVKALFNEYRDQGLRIVEVSPEILCHLDELIETLRYNLDHPCILFCDDLSFDRPDRGFLQLKVALEGGLRARPKNILIYATSNRRHLIRETFRDNLPSQDDDLHPEESGDEKVSLSDRFGLRLFTGIFSQETYLGIVKNYVQLRGIRIEEDLLRQRALEWAMGHGNFSGRTARQFVDTIEGEN